MLNYTEHLSFINNKFTNINFNKHFHDYYYFSLIYKGKLLYKNDNEKYCLSSGILQVVNPYEFHTTLDSTWSCINIMPSIDFVDSILGDMIQSNIKNKIEFKTIVNDEKATKLFYAMYYSFIDKAINQLEINLSVMEFFEYMLEHHTIKNCYTIANITSPKKNIKKALEYMNNIDMKDNLSLDDISLQINLSKFYFQKIFKNCLGITPSQYIQIKRVNWAKQMIEKKIPLAQIAYECGFNDQSYMIKIFKKYHGYTPKNLNSLKLHPCD